MTMVAKSNNKYRPCDNTQDAFRAGGSITLSGNYGGGATHGDTLDLSVLNIPSRALPAFVRVYETPAAGTLATGNIYIYCPGTTQKNGVVQIQTAAGTEYTQGSAYSAPLLAAILKFESWFPAFQP